MNKPHVHAECIKAWADGKQIQYLHKLFITPWVDYHGTGVPGVDDPALDWRVKPETIRYRVALFDVCRPLIYTLEDSARLAEYIPGFVRWLTDWIEVEV